MSYKYDNAKMNFEALTQELENLKNGNPEDMAEFYNCDEIDLSEMLKYLEVEIDSYRRIMEDEYDEADESWWSMVNARESAWEVSVGI